MEKQFILILDSDDKQAQNLSVSAGGAGYDVVIQSDAELWTEDKEKALAEMVLINYQTIVHYPQNKLIALFRKASQTKLIIYNAPADATRRLALYKLGAGRIFDVNSETEEIAAYVRIALKTDQHRSSFAETRINGNLGDIRLSEVIHSLVHEQRSGVLKISGRYGNGKIILNHGDIDDATAGNRRAEEAVYYLMTLQEGRFYLKPSEVTAPKHLIRISAPGLLIRAAEIRKKYFE